MIWTTTNWTQMLILHNDNLSKYKMFLKNHLLREKERDKREKDYHKHLLTVVAAKGGTTGYIK